MCTWSHSGWIVILPLAMMAFCILMCVFMRRHVFRGSTTCCGHGHGESGAESERKPQSDSRSLTG